MEKKKKELEVMLKRSGSIKNPRVSSVSGLEIGIPFYAKILRGVERKAIVAFSSGKPETSCPYRRKDLRQVWLRKWRQCADTIYNRAVLGNLPRRRQAR